MLEQIGIHQRQYSLQLRKESIETRLEHLSVLEDLIEKNQDQLCQALAEDFQKPLMESLLTEIYPLLHEIATVKKHLKEWAQPKVVENPLMFLGSRCEIRPEPRGVCLIISPWNYPVYLTFSPLISAIAAGNCVVIKPSELTRHTGLLLHSLIQKHFSSEHVACVLGGPETTQELLGFAFDHVFFTGSTRVGKIIMKGAAEHLTPVTLELGGKSPTIVDETVDLHHTAEKIVWAKFVNAGQTCVAPDYLFVQKSILPQFLDILRQKIESRYGANKASMSSNLDIARIISPGHTQRLAELVKDAQSTGAEVVTGGFSDETSRFMAPTLLTKVSPQSQIMKEEIFGPLLPVLSYEDLSEVIHFINERPRPLSIYLYSKSKMAIRQVTSETSSGSLVINDSVMQVGNPYLPFGGVGESGIGSSHGYYGFLGFSHQKSIMKQGFMGRLLKMTHPPYTDFKIKLMRKIIRWRL